MYGYSWATNSFISSVFRLLSFSNSTFGYYPSSLSRLANYSKKWPDIKAFKQPVVASSIMNTFVAATEKLHAATTLARPGDNEPPKRIKQKSAPFIERPTHHNFTSFPANSP